MTASDIKFYRAEGDDGGAIDENAEIVDGVLNNLMPDITASDAEAGKTVYRKFFVKNASASETANSVVICLTAMTPGEDYANIFPGTADDTTANMDDSKLYGIAKTTEELDRSTKKVTVTIEGGQDLTQRFAQDDKIVFVDATSGARLAGATVNAVDATSITVNEDIPERIVLDGAYVCNAIDIGTLDAGATTAAWVKLTVPSFCRPQEEPADYTIPTVFFD